MQKMLMQSSLTPTLCASSTDTDCRISNPLAGIPKHALMEDAATFAQEAGLGEQTELMQKGALVAQNPGPYTLSQFVPQC